MEDSKEKEKIKIPNCNEDIYINIVYAVTSIAYFIALSIVYLNCSFNIFSVFIKVSYMMYLILAILIYEVAYKKDSGKLAIIAIEYTVIAIYILLLQRIVDIFKFDMLSFIVTSSFVFPIYYVIKAIVIDTRERREELKKLSDIKDIVKEEKPSKKVAKKRKV